MIASKIDREKGVIEYTREYLEKEAKTEVRSWNKRHGTRERLKSWSYMLKGGFDGEDIHFPFLRIYLTSGRVFEVGI